MSASFGNPAVTASEIGGQFRQGKDEIVRCPVGAICKVLWPDKTDVEVAIICGCDPRNARRYMSGELPVPPRLLIAVNVGMVEWKRQLSVQGNGVSRGTTSSA